MNGIILVNKEKGLTSHDVISKIKKILKVKKIGHAGTLDPQATGLLVVMLNSATKLSNYLISSKKEYIAEILIGKSTDTLDSEGEIVEEKEVNYNFDIDDILKTFLGKSLQIPPMYSAIKKDGKKLYELARKGMEVERTSRDIEVYEIERISGINYAGGLLSFSFRVVCSKGTYIRTLCEDIGKKLNYPAHLKSLNRTKIANLKLEDSFTLKEIENNQYKLIPMIDALSGYPIIAVDEKTSKLILNGVELNYEIEEDLLIFTFNNELIGIYKKNNGKYKAERIWN